MSIHSGNDTITDSRANGNGQDGMALEGLNYTITDSQANGNKGGGIDFGDFFFDELLTGNTANDNGAVGISLACPSNLFGNTAAGNAPGDNIVTSGTGCVRLDNNPAP